MDGMCLTAALLLGGCFFLRVASQTGEISPPRNLSLTWIGEFELQLSWEPPQHSMRNCSYVVTVKSRQHSGIESNTWTTDWTVMDGGVLPLSVKTQCNSRLSDPAVLDVRNPELVNAWSCYVRSRDRSYCSWEPASSASQPRFYYALVEEGPDSDDGDPTPIRECRAYRYHDDGTRGCDIEAGFPYRIYIVLNETQKNSSVRNTFDVLLANKVKPDALNWTVQKTKDTFDITWVPPDIPLGWEYLINHTECDKPQRTRTVLDGTSFQLGRRPRCPYCLKIRAQSDVGGSPWSEEQCFDADWDPNAVVYAAVIIPLLFAGLAALMFACCRKNKENLFPKIPQPRDLLSDIADNNNKSSVCNVYVPAVEEESCKISLVIDPQVNKPDR